MTWQSIIDTVTYKPNTKFHITENYYNTQLHIEVLVPNTYDPGNLTPIKVIHTSVLPSLGYFPEKKAPKYIRKLVHNAEIHEADEWLRFNGVMLFNPHKE